MTAVRCAIPGQDVLGETPLWCDRTQSLLWLDIDAGKLQRFHPASGRHDVVNFDARHAGSLALTHDPSRVLLGLDLGLHFFDLGTGEQALLAQVEPAERDNRLNAGRCDAQGRFWVGTMDNALHRPNGAFYRVDASGEVRQLFDGVIVFNNGGDLSGTGHPVLFGHATLHHLAVCAGRGVRGIGRAPGLRRPQRRTLATRWRLRRSCGLPVERDLRGRAHRSLSAVR
jgi:sugar lactone lactonase YvrE